VTIPLVMLERSLVRLRIFTRRDFVVLTVNGLVYAFAITWRMRPLIVSWLDSSTSVITMIWSMLSMMLLRRSRLNSLPFTIPHCTVYTVRRPCRGDYSIESVGVSTLLLMGAAGRASLKYDVRRIPSLGSVDHWPWPEIAI